MDPLFLPAKGGVSCAWLLDWLCDTPESELPEAILWSVKLETNPCDGMELARRAHLPPTMDKLIEVPSATMAGHVKIYISGTE
jgi:hypothetical protein